jgi:hypothetical protein
VFVADAPLVDGVSCGAGEGASEVEENHPGDTSGAVVDGAPEAVGAAAVAGATLAARRVGEGGRRAHHSAVAVAEVGAGGAGEALVVGGARAGETAGVALQARRPRLRVAHRQAGPDTVAPREVLHQEQSPSAGGASGVVGPRAGEAGCITAHAGVVPLAGVLRRVAGRHAGLEGSL